MISEFQKSLVRTPQTTLEAKRFKKKKNLKYLLMIDSEINKKALVIIQQII